MTDPSVGATRATAPPPAPTDASTGQLVGQLTEQVSRLVRDEARLAQAEVTQKAKRLGIGAGLFGGAGLFAFFGLAALVVAVVLLAVAGVLALVGKKDVEKSSPPVPTEAIASTKADIQTVKESARR
jgi:putative superfamily III holin-X